MTEQAWTVRSILAWTQGYFNDKGIEDAKLSAEWLISHALGSTRLDLYLDPDRPLARSELDALHGFIVQRVSGEPLQYITKTASFRYLDLAIEPGVLIPRPETEVLVSEVLKELDHEEGDKLVADICCGSGCIACALASERTNVNVIAIDISPEACALSLRNVDACGLAHAVKVLQGDLSSPIEETLYGCFDCIVSNPPYVPSAVMRSLPEEVSAFEPTLALDGGEDGLDIYRRILAESKLLLRQGGILAVELYEDSLQEAAALAAKSGFESIRIVEDLACRPRILIARRG